MNSILAATSRTSTSSTTKLLLAILLAAVAFAPTATHAQCSDTDTNDIVTLACDPLNIGTFGTLCSRLRSTSLDVALQRSGNYRVFAPSNTAFSNAGDAAGVTTNQQRLTLQYHVTPSTAPNDLVALACGTRQNSLLARNNGAVQTSTTTCDGTTNNDLRGQQGNVIIPRNSPTITNNEPRFTADTNNANNIQEITACNGIITPIDNVMGFGTIVYTFGNQQQQQQQQQPCSFFNGKSSKSCKGAKGGGNSGSFVRVGEESTGGVTLQEIFISKARKQDKKGSWSNFNQFQTVYNNNNNNNNGGGGFRQQTPNYNNKSGKSNKNEKGFGGGGGFAKGDKKGKRERKLVRRRLL